MIVIRHQVLIKTSYTFIADDLMKPLLERAVSSQRTSDLIGETIDLGGTRTFPSIFINNLISLGFRNPIFTGLSLANLILFNLG